MLMPGSQSYDAWDEAFEAEPTGLIEVPSSLARVPTTSSGEIEALPPPETHSSAFAAPPDTNPAFLDADVHASGSSELPSSATHVDTQAVPPDTDPGH